MTNDKKKIPVTFFQRKARSVGNYSVEFIFNDVRARLKDQIEATTVLSTYESAGFFKRLFNCWEAARSQNVVNHVTGDVNYIGLWLSKRRTIHTILDCVFMTTDSKIKRMVLKYFWLTIPVKRSKYITAISTATKNEILRWVPCDPEKIVVIPVAISERFKRKDKIFNKANPVILQIGTAPNKNIPRLIESLKGIPCTLQIIGKKNVEYETALKENGIEYRYDSGLSDEQMLEKYEQADIIVLPSTYEGFGMPILEAQAVGRPVLTSNILSMPEVAGDAAHLVDPYNVEEIRSGLLKIIKDDAYRETLIIKGRENIKRFDPQLIAMQYYKLYEKIATLKTK